MSFLGIYEGQVPDIRWLKCVLTWTKNKVWWVKGVMVTQSFSKKVIIFIYLFQGVEVNQAKMEFGDNLVLGNIRLEIC